MDPRGPPTACRSLFSHTVAYAGVCSPRHGSFAGARLMKKIHSRLKFSISLEIFANEQGFLGFALGISEFCSGFLRISAQEASLSCAARLLENLRFPKGPNLEKINLA